MKPSAGVSSRNLFAAFVASPLLDKELTAYFLPNKKFCYEPKRYPRLQQGQQQREAVPRSTGRGDEEGTPAVRISIAGEPTAAAAAQGGVRRDIRRVMY